MDPRPGAFGMLRDHLWRRARPSIAKEVRVGLCLCLSKPRRLPAWLLRDDEAERILDRIEKASEYYMPSVERAILERHADEILAVAAGGAQHRLQIVELGAGAATRSQILLHACVQRQGRTLFVPVDPSSTALRAAQARLAREEPAVEVRPLEAQNEDALEEVEKMSPRRLVLFLGSSLGDLEDEDAIDLLRAVRSHVARRGAPRQR